VEIDCLEEEDRLAGRSTDSPLTLIESGWPDWEESERPYCLQQLGSSSSAEAIKGKDQSWLLRERFDLLLKAWLIWRALWILKRERGDVGGISRKAYNVLE
jgi:hypothetical protein